MEISADHLGLDLRRVALDDLRPGREPVGEEALHVPGEVDRGHRGALAVDEPLQGEVHLVAVLEPAVRVLLQGLEDDGVEVGGDAPAHGARCHRRLLADGAHQGEVAVGLVEPGAGDQLPEHDAQREDVRAVVEGLAARLLRRHVAVVALDHPHPRRLHLGGGLGDAEVDHLHLPLVGEDEVRRAHVPVDQVEGAPVVPGLGVGVVERLADLGDDLGGVGDRHRHVAAVGEAPLHEVEVLAPDELHGEEVVLAVLPEVEELDDVGVVELCRQPALVEEHLDEVGVRRQVGQDALDDDELLEPAHAMLAGEPDLGHPAGGEVVQQLVATELAAQRCPFLSW